MNKKETAAQAVIKQVKSQIKKLTEYTTKMASEHEEESNVWESNRLTLESQISKMKSLKEDAEKQVQKVGLDVARRSTEIDLLRNQLSATKMQLNSTRSRIEKDLHEKDTENLSLKSDVVFCFSCYNRFYNGIFFFTFYFFGFRLTLDEHFCDSSTGYYDKNCDDDL